MIVKTNGTDDLQDQGFLPSTSLRGSPQRYCSLGYFRWQIAVAAMSIRVGWRWRPSWAKYEEHAQIQDGILFVWTLIAVNNTILICELWLTIAIKASTTRSVARGSSKSPTTHAVTVTGTAGSLSAIYKVSL